jgi:hypothetical protein
MDLRNTQLKDTYGNLVTTGTTAGSPTTGGLQNGQGTLLTSVGIGTNDPSTELEVGGSSNTQVLISSTTNTGNSQLYFGDSDSDTAGVILYRHNGDSMAFEVNDAERLRIDSSGRVGIGTTSPDSPLTATKLLSGNSYLSPQSIRSSIENASVYGYFSSDSDDLTANKEQAGVLGIARVDSGTAPGSGNAVYGVLGVSSNAYGGGVNDFALGAIGDAYISGNVGIGTDSPMVALNVHDSTNARIALTNSSTGQTFPDGFELLATGLDAYLQNRSNGNMIFTTNNVERMRIDSSGNVGIGTDNPATRLDIQGVGGATTSPSVTATTGTSYIGWKSVNTGGSFWTAIDNSTGSSFSTGTAYARVLWSNGAYPMVFSTNSTERLRIDSSGNITHSGTSPQYIFKTASNTNFQIAVQENVSNALEITPSTTVGGTTFSNPALVVNSSGNVLVGKTSSSDAQTTVGHLFLPDGRHYATASGGVSGIFSRTSSDGDILSFYKDGTTVGSIGTEGGDMAIGNDDAGIQFVNGNEHFRPFNMTSNTSTDNLMDIGSSSKRFKDLYLSGSVYLGGTTSSNALDDYEEGTWTPAYTPTTGTFTTITTVATGRYTKIGRLVTVFGNVRTSGTLDVTGASGNLAITGLPFACNATLAGGGVDISHQLWNLGTDILNTGLSVDAGASQILMFKNTMNTSSFPSGNITVADMSTSGGSFNNLITFTVSYEV